MLSWFREKIGRRGLVLVFAGASWALVGVQMIINPIQRFTREEWPPTLLLSLMDHPYWGWMWIICGSLAVVFGLLRNRRPFCGRDDWGFNLIITPVVVITLFYLCSWGTHLITGGEYGRANASFGLVVWALISLFILTIADWPEIDDVINHQPPRQGGKHRDEL